MLKQTTINQVTNCLFSFVFLNSMNTYTLLFENMFSSLWFPVLTISQFLTQCPIFHLVVGTKMNTLHHLKSLFQYSRHSLQQKIKSIFCLFSTKRKICQLSLRCELFNFVKFSASLSSTGNKHFPCRQAILNQHINFNQPSSNSDCMWRFENTN